MSPLIRRLDALERLAEQVRRREARDLVLGEMRRIGWHDASVSEIDEGVDVVLRALDQTAAWRREGLTGRQILRRGADEFGVPVEEIEREYRAILDGRW